MNVWRSRNLIALSIINFAILGCFLQGCSERTENSPASSLICNINKEIDNYTKDGIKMTGRLMLEETFRNSMTTPESMADLKYYEYSLLNIPITLYKYNKATDNYEYLSKTVSDGTAYFQFNNLHDGSYKLVISDKDVFNSKEELFIINQDQMLINGEHQNSAAELKNINIEMTVNKEKKNNLLITVVSAHNGRPISNATIDIDGHCIGISDEYGQTTANNLSIGKHSIEIANNIGDYNSLKSCFEVYAQNNSIPTTVGGNELSFSLVETDNSNNSITGTIYSENKAPKFVRLFKFLKETDAGTNEVKYHIDTNFVRKTQTSYNFDGLPDGSFKFLNLEEGYYQIYVSTADDNPKAEKEKYFSPAKSEEGNEISNFKWQKVKGTDFCTFIGKPFKVTRGITSHWTNDKINCIER